MTLKSASKRILTIAVILALIAPAILGSGISVVDQIDKGANDLYVTETGAIFQTRGEVAITSFSVGEFGFWRFDKLGVPGGASIQEAVLSLHSWGPVKPEGDLIITMHGLKSINMTSWNPNPFGPSGFDPNLPTTVESVNVNVSNLQDNNWRNYTVTNIVRELTGQYGWNENQSIAIKSQAAASVERSVVAYEGLSTLAAKMYITYNEGDGPPVDPDPDPEETQIIDEEPEEVYQNITIWNRTLIPQTWSPLVYADGFFYTFNGTVFGNAEIATNFSAPANCTLLAGSQALKDYGGIVYGAFWNTTGANHGSIARTSDLGDTWTHILNWVDTGTFEKAGILFDNNDTWHISYVITNNEAMYTNYTVSSGTQSTPYEIWDAFADRPTAPELYLDELDNLYVAFAAQQAANSEWRPTFFARYANGTIETKRLTNFPLVITSRVGVDGYTDINGTERILFHWGHSDQSGTGDTKAWLYYISPGDEVGILPNINDGSGLPTYWEIVTDSNVQSVGWLVNPNTGAIWSMGYRSVAGNDPPAMSIKTLFNVSDPWTGGQVTHRQAIPTHTDTRENVIYWNNYNATPGASVILGGGVRKYYLDSAFLAFNGTVSPFDWLGDLHNSSAWAKMSVGDPPIISWGTTHQTAKYPDDSVVDTEFFAVGPDNVTLTGSCFDEAVTIEDIKECIDKLVGQQPQNPNPPGTNYPEPGFGVLTRFNLRFVIWGVGLVLIFAPLILMAWRDFPMKIYLLFFIAMVLGFALQWSLATI